MSDITISIPSEPIRDMVKSIVKEEMQPTLYGNDNTLAAVVNDEIDNSPRIAERIEKLAINAVINSSEVEDFINDSIGSATENNRTFRRAVETAVEGCIDYSEIANSIEVREVADRISVGDVASEICLDDLANEICIETLADHIEIDYAKLARALLRIIRDEAAAANANS